MAHILLSAVGQRLKPLALRLAKRMAAIADTTDPRRGNSVPDWGIIDVSSSILTRRSDIGRLPHKHVVFFDSFLDRDAGGISGRLALLRAGLDAAPSRHDVTVWIERRQKPQELPVPDEETLARIIARLSCPERLVLERDRYWRLMRGGTASIDVHRPSDALAVLGALRLHARTDVQVFMTIHAPDDQDPETVEYWQSKAVPPKLVELLGSAVQAAEDLALQGAAAWIFPTESVRDHCLQRHPNWSIWNVKPHITILSDEYSVDPVPFAQAYVDRVTAILDSE